MYAWVPQYNHGQVIMSSTCLLLVCAHLVWCGVVGRRAELHYQQSLSSCVPWLNALLLGAAGVVQSSPYQCLLACDIVHVSRSM